MDNQIQECTVCLEKVNKRNRIIQCLHCNYKACTSCSKRYILNSLNDPKCMNCKKDWDREFIVNSFSYTFVNTTYKKHRQNVIYDRQLSMMEETQKVVERQNMVVQIQSQIFNTNEKILDLRNQVFQLERKKFCYQHNQELPDEKKEDIIKFYGHCPENDCRGFINHTFKCGICKVKVCKTCKEKLVVDLDAPHVNNSPIYKQHTCNQSTIDSLAKIKKDSKPCPKCKCMIHRIEGCYQMWCTQCHTCYHWGTNEIVTRGVFHNPHMIEWQRTHRDSNINMCNGDDQYIAPYDVNRACRLLPMQDSIINFLRFLNHVEGIEIHAYRVDNLNYDHSDFLNLRIAFLKSQISEDSFKQKLQWKEKRFQKKQEIYMILDMFLTTGKYLMNNLVRISNEDQHYKTTVSLEEASDFMDYKKNLIDYTNESMKKISKRYKNKVPIITLANDSSDSYCSRRTGYDIEMVMV